MLKHVCDRICMLPPIIQALIVACCLMGAAVMTGFPN
jgi:hypothetical protein